MTISKPRAQTLLTMGLVIKLTALVLALVLAGPLATPGPQPVQAQEAKAKEKEDKSKDKDKAAKGKEKKKEGEGMTGAASAVSKRQKAAKGSEKSEQEYEEAKPTATKAAEYDPTLMKLIEQKRVEMSQEEARLAVERQELEKLRKEVDGRIAELKKVQEALNQLITTEKKQRRERIQRLVKVLSNMRGPAAAAVVEKLDDQMAVEIFSLMQSRQAGKVMSNLKPEQAARIGELLARRKASQKAAKLAGQAAAAGAQPPPETTPPAGKRQPRARQ